MAFKMKGNPIKMGAWATKSTMKNKTYSPVKQDDDTRIAEIKKQLNAQLALPEGKRDMALIAKLRAELFAMYKKSKKKP